VSEQETITRSVEMRTENGRPVCDWGSVSGNRLSSAHHGEIRDVSPLIIVQVPYEGEIRNLRSFGVDFKVENGFAYITATNGRWVWRLHPAHWKDGEKPDPNWCDDIMLGRWVD
jgi:hypothetical protein